LLPVPSVTARRVPLMRLPALQGSFDARPSGTLGSRSPPRRSGFLPRPRGSAPYAVPRTLSRAGSPPPGLRLLFRVLTRPARHPSPADEPCGPPPVPTPRTFIREAPRQLLPWGPDPHRGTTKARPRFRSLAGPVRKASHRLATLHPRGFTPPRRFAPRLRLRPYFMPQPRPGFSSPTYRGFAPPGIAVPPLGGRTCLLAASSSGCCRRLAPPTPPPEAATPRPCSIPGCVHVALGVTRSRRCAPLLAFPSPGPSLSPQPPLPFELGILPRASRLRSLRTALVAPRSLTPRRTRFDRFRSTCPPEVLDLLDD
jgi:hypothetical protein